MPDEVNLTSQPPMSAGSKKPLIIIAAVAAAVIVAVVLILVNRGQRRVLPTVSAPGAKTPVAAPAAGQPAPTSWTGALSLGSGDAKLSADGVTYDLFIGQAGQSSRMLQTRGFKTGDKINVVGKLSGTYIEVGGINR